MSFSKTTMINLIDFLDNYVRNVDSDYFDYDGICEILKLIRMYVEFSEVIYETK